MSMHPWVAEQLASSRRQELATRVGSQSLPAVTESLAAPPVTRPRVVLARQVGGLLIAVGSRLAGPEGFARALENARRQAHHSPA
jgi:hypothetical protein